MVYNLNTTINGLNATKSKWKECSRGVEHQLALTGDWNVEMIANNVNALTYHGEDDFVCN